MGSGRLWESVMATHGESDGQIWRRSRVEFTEFILQLKLFRKQIIWTPNVNTIWSNFEVCVNSMQCCGGQTRVAAPNYCTFNSWAWACEVQTLKKMAGIDGVFGLTGNLPYRLLLVFIAFCFGNSVWMCVCLRVCVLAYQCLHGLGPEPRLHARARPPSKIQTTFGVFSSFGRPCNSSLFHTRRPRFSVCHSRSNLKRDTRSIISFETKNFPFFNFTTIWF